jgi:hypothetical protein
MDQRRERHVGMEAFLAAAEDRGVAAFETKNRAVDRHVGPRLVDDADDADGDADFADAQAVRADGFVEDFADGIGQRDYFAHGIRQMAQFVFG